MIRFWSARRNLLWRQCASWALLLSLLFSIVAPPFAQASIWSERKEAAGLKEQKAKQAAEAFRSRGSADVPQAAAAGIESSGMGMEIPDELGTTVELWSGPEGKKADVPLVVHIQDAHGYYEAQKNAAQILKQLQSLEPDKPLLVLIEGAWARLENGWLGAFPEEGLKKAMVQQLFKSGQLTGEEYLSLTEKEAQKKFEIVGIEERKSFLANLKSRELVDRQRSSLLNRLQSLSTRLGRLQKIVYPGRLLELDSLARRYESRESSLKDYFNALKSAVPGVWDAARYPNLAILNDLVRLEGTISAQGVAAERERLLRTLGEKLHPDILAQLAQFSMNYRLGRLSSLRYHEALVRLAGIHALAVPGISGYVDYLRRSQALNGSAMSDELSGLERNSFRTLARGTGAAETLVEAALALRMQQKFWDEKLSPGDWKEYRENAPPSLGRIESQIRQMERERHLTLPAELPSALGAASAGGADAILSALTAESPDAAPVSLARLKFLQESYYKLAFKRDRIMLENVLQKAREGNRQRVVLIAGGFHTPGLTTGMREKGIAYAVVRPRLTPTGEGEAEASGEDLSRKLKTLTQNDYDRAASQYVKNLEALEEAGGAAKDRGALARIAEMVKNRIAFEGPLLREGKVYLLGSYQGDAAKVNFVMEFAAQANTNRFAATGLQDALKASMGTLREMLKTFVADLRVPPLTLLLVLGLSKIGVALPLSTVLADDQKIVRFLSRPLEIPAASDVTLADVRNLLGSNYWVLPDRIEEQEGRRYLHFKRNDALFKQSRQAGLDLLAQAQKKRDSQAEANSGAAAVSASVPGRQAFSLRDAWNALLDFLRDAQGTLTAPVLFGMGGAMSKLYSRRGSRSLIKGGIRFYLSPDLSKVSFYTLYGPNQDKERLARTKDGEPAKADLTGEEPLRALRPDIRASIESSLEKVTELDKGLASFLHSIQRKGRLLQFTLEDHPTIKGFGSLTNGITTLFLSKQRSNNPAAVLHELGEAWYHSQEYIFYLESKYRGSMPVLIDALRRRNRSVDESNWKDFVLGKAVVEAGGQIFVINAHTFMRGIGHDYADLLLDTKPGESRTAEGYIRSIHADISNVRPLTTEERYLIRYNWALGIRQTEDIGRGIQEKVFGIEMNKIDLYGYDYDLEELETVAAPAEAQREPLLLRALRFVLRGRVSLAVSAVEGGQFDAGEKLFSRLGVIFRIFGDKKNADLCDRWIATINKAKNLGRLQEIIKNSEGPSIVICIVNDGDQKIIEDVLEGVKHSIFREDGKTFIHVHGEVKPDGKAGLRGQLLGFVDAVLRLEALAAENKVTIDRERSILLNMTPGAGTRMCPLTLTPYGIKPLLPMLIRAGEEGKWLSGAEASMFTWTLVVRRLEELGFRGICNKWGDEPQIMAYIYSQLSGDWSDVDAILYGSKLEVSETLAENKEWVHVDPKTGKVTRYRRGDRQYLLKLFGQENEAKPEAMTHLGSPSLSYVLWDAIKEVFGKDFNQPGDVIDFDGYFFEALTQSPEIWERELARLKDLQAVVYGTGKQISAEQAETLAKLGIVIAKQTVDGKFEIQNEIKDRFGSLTPEQTRALHNLAIYPDYYALAQRVKAIVNKKRGRDENADLNIKAVDFGSNLYWGDIGQLAKARKTLWEVNDRTSPEGYFARKLAKIDHVKPDKWGNIVVGKCTIPQDGSVRNSVIINTNIYGSDVHIDGAVIVDSTLGDATVGRGSVVFGSVVGRLKMGEDGFSYRSIREDLLQPTSVRLSDVKQMIAEKVRATIVTSEDDPDPLVAVQEVHTTIPKDHLDLAKGMDDYVAIYNVKVRVRDEKGERWEWVEVNVGDKKTGNYTRRIFGNPMSFEAKTKAVRRRVDREKQSVNLLDIDKEIQDDYAKPLAEKIEKGAEARKKEMAIASFMQNPRPVKLRGAVQNYFWGGLSYIAGLLGDPNPEKKPFAELWMGVHKLGTAEVKIGEIVISLGDLITSAARSVLGDEIAGRFEGRLPYLFKILDAEENMLSIQVHPDKKQAARGFLEESAAGERGEIKPADRLFKDTNHVPEAAVVISDDFWLLQGFAKLERVAQTFRSVPGLEKIMPEFEARLAQATDPETQGRLVEDLFRAIMTMDQKQVNAIIKPILAEIMPKYESGALDKSTDPNYWVARAVSKLYKDKAVDRSIFLIYIMNLVHLKKGDAVYQEAGVIHSYLQGTIAEIKATSDNVGRVGLTEKKTHPLETLARLIKFKPADPFLLVGERGRSNETVYRSPAEEFELSRIDSGGGTIFMVGENHGPDILIVTEGEAVLSYEKETIVLKRGEHILVPANVPYSVDSRRKATLFRATVPINKLKIGDDTGGGDAKNSLTGSQRSAGDRMAMQTQALRAASRFADVAKGMPMRMQVLRVASRFMQNFPGSGLVAGILLHLGEIRSQVATMGMKDSLTAVLGGLFRGAANLKVLIRKTSESRSGRMIEQLAQAFAAVIVLPPVMVVPGGEGGMTALLHPGIASFLNGKFISELFLRSFQGQIDVAAAILTLVTTVVALFALFKVLENPVTSLRQSLQIALREVSLVVLSHLGNRSGIATSDPGDDVSAIAAVAGDPEALARMEVEQKAEAAQANIFEKLMGRLFGAKGLLGADASQIQSPRMVLLAVDYRETFGKGAEALRVRFVQAVDQIRRLQAESPHRRIQFSFVCRGGQPSASLEEIALMFGIPQELLQQPGSFIESDVAGAREKIAAWIQQGNEAPLVIATPSLMDEFKELVSKNALRILALGEKVTLKGVSRGMVEALGLSDAFTTEFSAETNTLTIDGVETGAPSTEAQIRALELLAKQA